MQRIIYKKIMAYNLLKGKRGIIFGALNNMSIAWKVAERCAEEGAKIVLSNTEMALRMGELNELSDKINAPIIAADATNYDDLNKTLDISAISFHKMLQAAKKTDAIAEYGSVVALTYIASHRTFFGYNDMADAKSLLESIARSFGYIYGREKSVRINTVSQSPTPTTAGKGIKDIDSMMDFADKMSPLGNASADDCADYCVTLFSDLTRKVTMQTLFHDGGFSNMGMSLRAMNQYSKDFDAYKDEEGKIIYG